MMQTAVLLAAWCLLSACATRSHPAELQTRTAACDPRLISPIEPEPPELGSIVQPATEQERAAVAAFLSGEAQARDWGREGWARAAIARDSCLTATGADRSSRR